MTNLCSIIITTYNRLSYLKKCLAALMESDYENYEIIVVNDGSTDETKKFLADLENKKIRAINHEKNLGTSEARNSGINAAKHDLIAFTDDDCSPADDWLKNLLNPFDDDKIGFTFGPTYYVSRNYKAYFPERCVNVINWPGGGNIAFRKNVFQKISFFDKNFDAFHNEDSELAIRAASHGIHYSYVQAAVCLHQQMDWTPKSLLSSAKNGSVWPVLKKVYPEHYKIFNPPISGIIVNPKDYLYFLFLPVLIPFLLIRYLLHGKRDLKIFFLKWPVYLFLKRCYIYKEAVRNKIWMI